MSKKKTETFPDGYKPLLEKKYTLRGLVPSCAKYSQRGAALVITLLVVSVLTVIVIGFLASMSTERITADSYSALTQAELAVDAGTADAAQLISNAILDNPWHGIGVKHVPENSNSDMLPAVLFGGTDTTAEPRSDFPQDPPERPTSPIPLFSYDYESFDDSNSVDLNFQRDSDDENGWIGARIDVEEEELIREPAPAHWVEILQNPDLDEQSDPNLANYNPVVARYAFWIEDETAKVDYSVVGNDNNGGSFERSNESNTTDDLDIGAIPLTFLTPLNYPSDLARDINSDIVDYQSASYATFNDPRVLNQTSEAFPGSPEDVADTVKFHATTFSLSNDLTMAGRRRANLNAIVTNSTDPDVIAADIDDIAYVISGQHVMLYNYDDPEDQDAGAHPNLTNQAHDGIFLDQPEVVQDSDKDDPDYYAPMPEFGERFYSGNASGISTELKRDIYLKKIAANIRDYIDTDSQPTYVNGTPFFRPDPTGQPSTSFTVGEVISNIRPTNGLRIADFPPQAIGKEAVPYFLEHAWRGFVEEWEESGTGDDAQVTATIRIDHYFEFLNPTTKDYTAPNGTFIKVSEMPNWKTGSFPTFSFDDFVIDISGITFAAGCATIITTNPDDHPPSLILDDSRLFVRNADPESGVRIENLISNEVTSNHLSFELDGRSSSSSITDYVTVMFWATDSGFIDVFPALGISLRSDTRWNITDRGNNIGSNTRFVYASSIGGSGTSRSGDPRSLSEQLDFQDYNEGNSTDRTRFFGSAQGHRDDGNASENKDWASSPVMGQAGYGPDETSFGVARSFYTAPTNWPDFNSQLEDTANTAYSVIRDNVMTSIGELGHIYDPHRKRSSDIRHARGGGRSLKIGQQDDLIPSTRFGTSGATTEWFNAAWRLCDLFSAEDAATDVSSASSRGRININGALRDNGVAIAAALREFVFLQAPDGDVARAGRSLSNSEIENLVGEIIDYLEANGPMLERGELSQLEFFSGSQFNQRAGGQRGNTSIDRSREEIFRRVVELITTRSLSFSIYCLGEAVRQYPNGNLQTEARSAKRTVIHLLPQTDASGTPTALDDSTDVSATPTSFRIEKIHESRLF